MSIKQPYESSKTCLKEFPEKMEEDESCSEWKREENSFSCKQARLRSRIRIAKGRAKPIDFFIHYINNDGNLIIELREPSTYLNGLTIHDLEDLLADIRDYTESEKEQQSTTNSYYYDAQYWQDIKTIAEDELTKLKKSSSQLCHDGREGINTAVLSDVLQTFQTKTIQQLENLEQQIRSKIEHEEDIDVSYWNSLLSQLQVYLARERLQRRHQLKSGRKLQQLKQDQGIFNAASSMPSENDLQPGDDLESKCLREYEEGRYSPVLLNINDPENQNTCTNETDDWIILKQQREFIVKSDEVKRNDVFEDFIKSMDGLTSDDTAINTVLPIDLCSDKYQLKKPRFFNKLHAGYDWNPYNRKRYDKDNPPPKTITGYKFNIYYPDLIDKSKIPTCSLTICEDNRELSILKIHAGPPYQDVAFKIVNKEWDYSPQHGYRCHFRNGIFQLWFHFRKMKYRR